MANKIEGRELAAKVLIALGPEYASQIFKNLDKSEIEQLTLEIANIKSLSSEENEKVIDLFYNMCLAEGYLSEGGIEYAKTVLEKALGSQKALEIINHLTSTLQVKPFDFMRKADPAQILNFIQNEHPQTIALVLSYLEPSQAGLILSSLPKEKQVDIAKRIASMDRTSPEIIREVESVLEKKLSNVVIQNYDATGGIKAIVDILNSVDRSTEKNIIESLEVSDLELAEEIRNRMFVFEDIVSIDNKSVQRIFREVNNHDIALALKGASDAVTRTVFNNMSKRLADMIKEDIQYMGPVRLKDVEEAQQRIVNVIRTLEDAGEIIISRGGGDEIIE